MSIVLHALVALAATALPPAPSPGAAGLAGAGLAPAAIGGRLVLRDGSAAMTPKEARRALGGGPLALHLRSGWETLTARLDDDGFFVAEGAPGDWVVEYVTAGDRVEFLDPPMTVRIRGGEVACAGEIELAFRDLGAEMGQGTGRAGASDRCAELRAQLGAVARGRAIRPQTPATPALPSRRSAWEIASSVRAGAGWRLGGPEKPDGSGEVLLTATAVVGWNRPVGAPGAVVVAGALTQVDEPAGRTRRSVSGGLGYTILGFLEVMAGPEVYLSGTGGSGGGVFGQLRLGSEGFGLSARISRGKAGEVRSYGLDIAPLWLLGVLL